MNEWIGDLGEKDTLEKVFKLTHPRIANKDVQSTEGVDRSRDKGSPGVRLRDIARYGEESVRSV